MNNDSVEKAQAVYTNKTLDAYDAWLDNSNKVHWCCPTEYLIQHYNENITVNHLDVGAGTGFYMDNVRFPGTSPRVGFLDLNTDCLQKAKERVKRFDPECYQHNILEPLAISIEPFSSISINHVFHCLPGTFNEKGIVFQNLKAILAPRGRVFGATILGKDVDLNEAAQKLQTEYNAGGAFNNKEDSLQSLESALSAHFTEYELKLIGCVGVFSAIKDG